VKRREFITLLGGAAAWPLAAGAQQRAVPVVAVLIAGISGETERIGMPGLLKGLSESGYVENDRLPELAVELVRRRPAVIVTPLSVAAASAAKVATSTIPIVFSTGIDPVQAGLVDSLNRPGHNITGVVTMNNEIGAKRLELLRELLPGATRFALLVNPTNPLVADADVADLKRAAAILRREIEILPASTNLEIDAAFIRFRQKRLDALLVDPDPFFSVRRAQILTLAARHAVPVIYGHREDTEAGGLMMYGSSITDVFRLSGIYAGRILKGEKPADLPVNRATKFEFIINLQTAKTFDIEIPATLLARADELIE
jgi:putative ABC transport system substrate-binding protein